LSLTTGDGDTAGQSRKLLAQRLGDVGHRIEIALPALMDPAQHLARAEGLFALLREPGGQAFGIEIEEIDGHS
jgi:hypothetical protein